ncbi:MAG: ABC transporter permease [Nocardioidaceae bacterium]
MSPAPTGTAARDDRVGATADRQDPRTALEVEQAPESVAAPTVERTGWWRWIGQPVFVLVAVAAVALYVRTAGLSTSEGFSLNRTELQHLTVQHIQLTVAAAALVVAIAIPLGVVLTRGWARRSSPLFVGIANVGQAAPSIGLIVLAAMWIGRGFLPAVLALALYGILPALGNTIVGLQQVDPRLVEAGRGMGMSALGVLFRIELRLAVPVILAGVRLALVLLTGTATLAAFTGAGGLGSLINTGIKLNQQPVIVCGAVLVAALALLIDWLGRVVEALARPRGM